MTLQPSEVAGRARGAGDHDVFVLGQACDGKVGLDAALRVEPLGIDGAARRHGDIAGADLLQHRFRVAPLHQELGEGGLVEDRNVFARRAMLLGRRLEPVLPAPGIHILRVRIVRREPVRPFPAEGGAETGARQHQMLMDRRTPRATRGLWLAERPVHGVEQPDRFRCPVVQIVAVDLIGVEAADIDIVEVVGRRAIDDPFRQRHADTASRLNANGVEAGGHE